MHAIRHVARDRRNPYAQQRARAVTRVASDLAPDFLVAGKAIAGGVPCAVYGFTAELAARMANLLRDKPAGHSGMGTTLAANALATAALVACLEHVMTDAAYAHMLQLSTRLAHGLTARSSRARLCLACHECRRAQRAQLRAPPPRTARESLAASQPALEQLLHLYLLNRGVLVTPFHNMMLVSPATTAAQVDRLLARIRRLLRRACCNDRPSRLHGC